jgi:hypothetical protein
VKGTMLTIAKDVHRHAVAALKNVEGWFSNWAIPVFWFYWNCWSIATARNKKQSTGTLSSTTLIILCHLLVLLLLWLSMKIISFVLRYYWLELIKKYWLQK